MKYKFFLAVLVTATIFSCRKNKDDQTIPPPPPPAEPVFLKDIVHASLPSPYYHFEYESGKYKKASHLSGFSLYDVIYNGDKISEIKNNTAVNKDRLQYEYDNAGKVSVIKFINENNIVFKRCFPSFNGNQLIKLEWERKVAAGFVLELTLSFTYKADGNLLELNSHQLPFEGRTESQYTERYEQYDNKINTDAFSLVHEDGEHLILLPGVQLQKNNPQKVIRSGVGTISYTIDYTYTYDQKNAPLTKTGNAIFTNGPNAGQRFTTNTTYTYY